MRSALSHAMVDVQWFPCPIPHPRSILPCIGSLTGMPARTWRSNISPKCSPSCRKTWTVLNVVTHHSGIGSCTPNYPSDPVQSSSKVFCWINGGYQYTAEHLATRDFRRTAPCSMKKSHPRMGRTLALKSSITSSGQLAQPFKIGVPWLWSRPRFNASFLISIILDISIVFQRSCAWYCHHLSS